MEELLSAENDQAIIDRHEFCPFHPEGTIDVYARESDRRKPKPGMIHSAAKALALDLERSWVVGDAARDIEAGKNAGTRAVLFSDPSLPKSPAAEEKASVDPDYVVTSLAEAIDFIEKNPEPGGKVIAPERPPTMPVMKLAGGEDDLEPEPQAADEPAAPEPAPTATPRQPKVVIGSKYVPPAGREAQATPERKKAARSADEPAPAPPPATGFERMESLLEQIFLELRRTDEQRNGDFSVSKLLAGIAQMLAVAVFFFSYFKRDSGSLQIYLLCAIMLQTMTVALLIMSRQK
jgi:hypothetical protein